MNKKTVGINPRPLSGLHVTNVYYNFKNFLKSKKQLFSFFLGFGTVMIGLLRSSWTSLLLIGSGFFTAFKATSCVFTAGVTSSVFAEQQPHNLNLRVRGQKREQSIVKFMLKQGCIMHLLLTQMYNKSTIKQIKFLGKNVR